MKISKRNPRNNPQKAFTLVELIVVIAIIAVLAAITFVAVSNYVDTAKATADASSLRTLDNATALYRLTDPDPDPFASTAYSDGTRITALDSSGYIAGNIEPQQAGVSFHWDVESQLWQLITGTIQTGESGWWASQITGYTGSATDINIPATQNGITITGIYQDAFKDLGITSVSFADDSVLTRIHARAFKDNDLTTIVFPTTLTSIDTSAFENNQLTAVVFPDSLTAIESRAFYGNNITTITIGDDVTIGSRAFGSDDAFRSVYYAQGAGTYVYVDGTWIKQ